MAAILAAAACEGGKGGGQLSEPCTTTLGVTIDGIAIEPNGAATNLHLDLTLADSTTSDVRILGFIVECRYLDPDRALLRGTCTVELVVPSGDVLVVVDEPCPPGTVSWVGTPTGDAMRCSVEVLYSYTDVPCTPPAADASVTGADAIDVLW